MHGCLPSRCHLTLEKENPSKCGASTGPYPSMNDSSEKLRVVWAQFAAKNALALAFQSMTSTSSEITPAATTAQNPA